MQEKNNFYLERSKEKIFTWRKAVGMEKIILKLIFNIIYRTIPIIYRI